MYNFWPVFLLLLHRQWRVFKKDFSRSCVNEMILMPAILSFSAGYFVPLMYFGPHSSKMATVMFAGIAGLRILIGAFTQGAHFTADRLQNGYLSYQLSVAPLWVVLLARIIFSSFSAAFSLITLFPVVKLLLGSAIDLGGVNWVLLYTILLCGSFVLVSYLYMVLAFVRNISFLDNLWSRAVEPIMYLGGYSVPWKVINTVMPKAGFIGIFAPLTYVTEGLRYACFPHDGYLAPTVCLPAMGVLTIIYVALTYYLLKRRLDCL